MGLFNNKLYLEGTWKPSGLLLGRVCSSRVSLLSSER